MLLPLLLLTLQPAPQDLTSRERREVQDIIEEYVQVDRKSEEGIEAQEALLQRVDELVPEALGKREQLRWKKAIFDAWEDGPKIPRKSGSNHFWPDEKRGLYLISGKTKRPKGLLIGMHGGGVGSGDCRAAASYLSGGASDQDWLAIFPEVLEKTEHGWTTSGTEEWVIELVDRALRTYEIDPNRVYFAGHSMGGFGSWTLGAHHADRLAAAGPTAGAPTPYVNSQGVIWDIEEGVVPNLRNLAVRVFQSADDPQVPPDSNRLAVEKVKEAKERWGGYADFEYIETETGGHSLPPGGGKAWLEQLAPFERNPHPAKVVWQPTLGWKRQFYWLYWMKPQRGVTIVAELVGDNVIEVETSEKVSELYVLLSSAIVDMDQPVTIRRRGAREKTHDPEATLSVMLRTGARGDEGLYHEAWLRVP